MLERFDLIMDRNGMDQKSFIGIRTLNQGGKTISCD
jgi:hypothetical protein